MAVERERPTLRVSNIPPTSTAHDLFTFLESAIGAGTVFALEIFSERKNWRSRGHGRVQFETLESASTARTLSLQSELVFKGSVLSLSVSYDDIVARPVEVANRGLNGTVYAGLMVDESVACVIQTWEDVGVQVMPERKCVEFLIECGSGSYKLEIPFDHVSEACGCYLDRADPSAVLLKLKYAPKIYQKLSGPNVAPRFTADRYHICKEDVEFLWVRTTDFSDAKPIGLSSVICCEIPEGSVALDVFSSIPCFNTDVKDLILEEWTDYFSTSGLVPQISREVVADLDYEVVFQLNSLVHTQKISLAAVDDELIGYIGSLSVETCLMIFQKLHKLMSMCYKPLDFMKAQVHHLTAKRGKSLQSSHNRLINQNIMSCHRALITPTKIYLLGPELESSNYVVKNFAAYASDFMRVTFVDEDWGRLMPHFVSTSVQQGFFSKPFRTDVYDRILSVLREGIVIGNKKFQFLAFSASQLRSNSVWMFASNDKVKAEDIREWMGSFSKIRSVSKCAARMGQLFSSSKQTLVVPVQDVEVIPDIEVNTDGMTYCFSDGIGKISLAFAKQVAQKCGLSHTPSAFQIRYGGYKGVIAVDRNSFRKLSLRSSMLKFESRNRMLNVTKWSDSMPCYLNREIVVLLSTLGVEDRSFEKLLEQQVHLIGNMMTSKEAALAVLEAVGMSEGKSILPRMLRCGYEPRAEPYLSMMLQAYLDNQLFDIRYRCRLYVPKGRILLGCLDETGVLEYGQVYARITLTKSELEDINQSFFQRVDEKTAVVKGKVVVTKNPCLHPGDVRVLEAVYEVTLEEKGLVDCLIFPQKGERPHPNECSGGDLDGDLYFICWDESLRPPKTVPPMDYTARRPRIMDHDVTLEEIQQFFVHYMISDSLGAISTAHLVHADRDPEKALSPKCLQLADLHSMAVDFAKTGAPAEMPRALKPREYPDFMERYEKPTYTSQGALGKVYRATLAQTADTQNHTWSLTRAEATYDPDLEFPGFEAFLEYSRECREKYKEKMNSLMSFYGARNENEIVTGNLRRHSGFLQRDNRRYLEIRDRILDSVKSLQMEAKGWFESGCGGGQRREMAAAWYHVTYSPAHAHDSGNCVSFPWVVGDILLGIKSSKQQKLD